MPAISIITPCFNGARYIDALVASVRAQTFSDWEHVIVDDGSSDGSAAAVQRHMQGDARLTLISQANGGVARARRTGYRASNVASRYVYFLDVDDLLEPEMLQVMVDYLDRHRSVGLAYCAYTLIDDAGRPLPDFPLPRYAKTRFGVRRWWRPS